MAVDVVAGRDHVGAGVEEVIGGALGDADAPRRVLAVDDHQVRGVLFPHRRQRFAQPLPPRAADHVTDE